MPRVDGSRYQTFGEITERLDDIVAQVRDKDVSLELSLDLFDEAIALGSKAVSLVDATDFSPEEEARLVEDHRDSEGQDAPAGSDGEGPRPDDAPGDESDAPVAEGR